MQALLVPGAAAGLVGLLAFSAVHAVLISPIWRALPRGAPFALLGGVAVAWAFQELCRAGALRAGYRGALLLGTLLWLALVPMTAFGAVARVLGLRSALGPWEVAVDVALAAGSGAAAGWALTRRRRAASALGAATVALALATGGPVPLTSSVAAAALFAWLLPICAIGALTVVAAGRALARRRARPI